MNEFDLSLRKMTYRLFVEFGRAPTVHEVAIAASSDDEEIRAGWHRLHDAHALVLQQGAVEIRMANPFSAIPTAYRVRVRDQWWYANCAWDAFGVCAALRADGRIETSCADCGEALKVVVTNRMPDDETFLFHCLVPASRWWDDIVFT